MLPVYRIQLLILLRQRGTGWDQSPFSWHVDVADTPSNVERPKHLKTFRWLMTTFRHYLSFLPCVIMSSVCLSVCPSVTLCIAAKRYILQQKCLKSEQQVPTYIGTRFCYTPNGPSRPKISKFFRQWPVARPYVVQSSMPPSVHLSNFHPQNFQVWNNHTQHADNGYSRQRSVAI